MEVIMIRNSLITTLCIMMLFLVCSCDITTAPDYSEPVSIAPSLGDGSSQNPFQVSSLGNLYWISQNEDMWDKHYIQIADIDASYTADWFDGEGWKPIGSTANPFAGVYNGNGKKISGLHLNRSNYNLALFGVTNSTVIKNLALINVNIAIWGRVSNTGSLVGQAIATDVSNCNSSGTVSGSILVGGLIGSLRSNSTITGSYSTTNTDGESCIGGLVGFLEESLIKQCYSTASATAISGEVGGLVGRSANNSLIKNCYSRAEAIVLNPTNAGNGGLVGRNDSAIENSYSTGNVIYENVDDPENKGFVGYDEEGIYNANFFDSEASNQNGSIGATAKSTAEMKNQSTFTDAGWDFDQIWDIEANINDGYPYLRMDL